MIRYINQNNSESFGYGYVVLIMRNHNSGLTINFLDLQYIYLGIFWYYDRDSLQDFASGTDLRKDDQLFLSNHFDFIPYWAVVESVHIDRRCVGQIRLTKGFKSPKFIHYVSLFINLAQFKGKNENRDTAVDQPTSSGRPGDPSTQRNMICPNPNCENTIGPWLPACSAECAKAMNERRKGK
jgi:hypothetical protein